MKKGMWMLGIPMFFSSALAETAPVVEETIIARSPFAVPSGWLLILTIAALVVALIVVGVLRGQLKTAGRQAGAENYIREGSFDLHVKQDHFLYQTVERRKIE